MKCIWCVVQSIHQKSFCLVHYDELDWFILPNIPAENDVCCPAPVPQPPPLPPPPTPIWLLLFCWLDDCCWFDDCLPCLDTGGCKYSCLAKANTSIRSSLRYAKQPLIKLWKENSNCNGNDRIDNNNVKNSLLLHWTQLVCLEIELL